MQSAGALCLGEAARDLRWDENKQIADCTRDAYTFPLFRRTRVSALSGLVDFISTFATDNYVHNQNNCSGPLTSNATGIGGAVSYASKKMANSRA